MNIQNPYNFERALAYFNSTTNNNYSNNNINMNNIMNVNNNTSVNNNKINNSSKDYNRVSPPTTSTTTTTTTSNSTELKPEKNIKYLPSKLSKEEKEDYASELHEKLTIEYDFLSVAEKLNNPISFKIIPEYIKFIVLKAIEGDEGDLKLSGSPLVCKMWSIHIGMADKYQAMLDMIGVRALAYKPQLLKRNKYEKTLELIQKYFGRKKNHEIWPASYLTNTK
ncbi:hypothetical protein DICPUDRAFT_93300 [Dictyostelium purpureum]|uniref:Uncharacterized protein n=1 Tax=Dictyostelium purpureum TaxID=5786 RepID=F1A5C4_DICPU|nr:uncharacterized protein DICPUDRAFT_93300 [Dictyostelium purpureum]EGC28610.1 hypothetical protein DICPUDRAFT_93300 [Dictyostelium purpureum]|eukprot:XP_003294868.1 hypothetical protein DICPUDRAFT_93300 [Dictyostelium purpureum]